MGTLNSTNTSFKQVSFSNDYEPRPESYYEPSYQAIPRKTIEHDPYARSERRKTYEGQQASMRKYDQPTSYGKQSDYYDEGYQNTPAEDRYPSRRQQQRSNVDTLSSPNYELNEEPVPYSTRSNNQQSEYRRNQQERNKRNFGANEESRETTAERGYNNQRNQRVNESSIVFGATTKENAGRSPPSRIKVRGASPDRDDIAAGRPTKLSTEDKKGKKSDGHNQKSTSNLLIWEGMNQEETKSRGNSVERRMLNESVNYPRRDEGQGNFYQSI